MNAKKRNSWNPDILFLKNYCNTEFRNLVYNDIVDRTATDKESIESFLTKNIENKFINLNLKDFDSTLKCAKIFDQYRSDIAQFMQEYMSKAENVDEHLEVFFDKYDPLCFYAESKQDCVLYCVQMMIIEWYHLYKWDLSKIDIADMPTKEVLQ
jgi:hypothetical protein